MKMFYTMLVLALVATGSVLFSCDDDEGSWGDFAGQPCDSADECYPDVEDQADLSGPVVCLDDVEGGYCTHECNNDADCCSVPGECNSDLPQVCAPFQSNTAKYCMISCEDQEDPDGFCAQQVHPDFNCRSTGGGTENRKICMW